MNNAIKILSIIALILSCLGLLLSVLALTIFWEPLNLLFNSPAFIVDAAPIIPIGSTIGIFGCIFTTIVLLISVNCKRYIIIEILAILFLGIVLPTIAHCVGVVQTIWIGRYLGDSALATLNMETTLTVLASRIVNISSWLCLLTCGMRIAEKNIFKKQKSEQVVSNQG